MQKHIRAVGHPIMAMLLVLALGPAAGAAATWSPRLVVVVVVDQLRGDLPARAAAASGADGGFGQILRGGLVYEQAFYDHATTATAPGHATLFTGANPSQHGIVANEWYDRDARQRTTAVRSPEHGRELGPWNLLATTVGDELALSCATRCRVFAVSGKDRGAILPGGHLGKAFWFDGRGGFRSDQYYYSALPEWVTQWNAAVPKSAYPAEWSLAREPSRYAAIDADDRPFERPPAKLGRTFPHVLGRSDEAGYFRLFTDTPYLDALTLQFVRKLIDTEALGMHAAPDFLAVSLSSTDYVGHSFGPESLEAEDNLARLDGELGAFIAFLDQRLGREHYLLALTADHGLAATPEHAASLGYPARRLEAKTLAGTVEHELAARLHAPEGTVSAFMTPGLYLDRARLAAAGIEPQAAAAVAAEVLRQQPGIAYALTGNEPSTEPLIAALVRNSVLDARSGDVYVIPEPESAIVESLDLYTAYHGTPYAADRYVPLYFLGGALAPQHVDRQVSTRSLAPTLALVLGVPAPSYASAPVLVEVTAARVASGRPRR